MRNPLKCLSKYFLLIAMIANPLAAQAKQVDCVPITNQKAFVGKFTNYAPAARPGAMNGRCGTSASGYDACQFLLEDHLAGRSNAVMGAVPQRGGTSDLFGGIYQGEALEQNLGVSKCIRVFAGDRYNTKSNGMSKMDIVTKEIRSPTITRVNTARGSLIPLGRAPGMKVPRRKIQRMPEAQALEGNMEPALLKFFRELFQTS